MKVEGTSLGIERTVIRRNLHHLHQLAVAEPVDCDTGLVRDFSAINSEEWVA